MTVPYERTGRVSQKARTRDALVTAAREILAEGASPTIESAAARAAVSRTTAYRYFPSVRWLLTAAYPHIDRPTLLDANAPSDPQARLEIVVDDHMRRILTHEAEQRAVLRLSLESGRANPLDLPMHRGMRIGWVRDALAPLRGRMPDDALDALMLGIGATIGIEAFVWLTDVAECSREEAVGIMRANATALLRTALAGMPGEGVEVSGRAPADPAGSLRDRDAGHRERSGQRRA